MFAADVSDQMPPFMYSIGLMQTYNHPEFIVFGLAGKSAHALIPALVREIASSKAFGRGEEQTVNVGGTDQRVGFGRVQHPLYLGFAMGFCRRIGRMGELDAMQVFWPDDAGKFPFHVGCDLDVFGLQRRLDRALTPSEISDFQRRWQS